MPEFHDFINRPTGDNGARHSLAILSPLFVGLRPINRPRAIVTQGKALYLSPLFVGLRPINRPKGEKNARHKPCYFSPLFVGLRPINRPLGDVAQGTALLF
jgi:hypothetical protein